MQPVGTVRRRLLVSGRVQGVWFRESTRRRAEEIGGLSGFVRNLPDGCVEVVVQGAPERVDALVAYCWQGPERAQVDGVEAREVPVVAAEEGFRVVR